MKRVACWDKSESYTIVNPDADALADSIFRATHTDFPLKLSTGRAGGVRTATPNEFLAAVLEPKDHVLVPVVGEAGTGKSHLIRWIDLQLRNDRASREVIYVHKAQTNLRDIIQSLVKRLPEDEREPYSAALNSTGSESLSPIAQRTAILNQINLALVNDRGGVTPEMDAGLEEFALEGLRAMFSDPHIRKSLVTDNAFAAELAAHVFHKPENYSPAEERREFKEKDLPLQAGDFKKAAAETREFLAWLMGSSADEKAQVLRIVNRHVDWAISNCLNLSGDRLIELMLDLRRHFRRSKRELVLLIEDFARLQGLDRALLQSILEQQPDLCVLRTVFASTSGFYESLESTVKTRVSFLVDMNLQDAASKADLDQFVVRYMNAARWGVNALEEQWNEVQRGAATYDISSKCDGCPHISECHADFGAVDGMGFYPFTSKAIDIMAVRARTESRAAFNPRELLKYVLQPVALSGGALLEDAFPPTEILTSLGGRTMPPAQLLQIQRDDPNNWERRVTMLELWGGTLEVTNLAVWLHTAFAIPVLAGRGEIVEDTQPKNPDPVDAVRSKVPSARVKELRDWQEERLKLSSATAQLLRDHVHAALADFVDWDEVGLAKSSTVSKKSGLFKAGQISFQNQATQRSDAQISLLIPTNWNDEAERIRTTLALEGLLEAKDHGDWSYPDGLQKLGCLLECLRQWAEILVTQCKAADVASDGVDIGVLSFELRATLQAVMNSDQPMTSNQEVLKAAFGDLHDRAPDFLTDELSALVLAIRQQDGELLGNISSRYTATKGGDPGGFLDSARLLPLAASLRRRRFLPAETSSAAIEKRSSLGPVRSLAKQVTENWTSALLREANARAQLKSQITEFLGERTPADAIIQSVQRLADSAAKIGVPGAQSMLPVKSRFEQIAYADLLALLRAADPEKLDTRELCSGAGSSGKVVNELLKSSADLLKRTVAEAQGRLADEGADPNEKAQVIRALTDDLDEIGTQLERYHDGKLN